MDPSTELVPASLGVISQRYELSSLLGVGGMGTVYRALDRELGEVVALELLRAHDGRPATTEQIERLRREVRLARRVTHPNATRIYDLGHDAQTDHWYLTMELISGETLGERLARAGRLEAHDACRIAADICAGLGAIHAAGIVHRDLRPGNILLVPPAEGETRERVVVTDFGIAKSIELCEESFTHAVIGTPGYMAPEQALGTRAIDPRSDIFALGTILFQMLSGQHPNAIATPQGSFGQWPPKLDPMTGVDDVLSRLVTRCLGRQPHQRPDSCKLIEPILRSLADDRDVEPERLRVAWSRGVAPAPIRQTLSQTKPVLSIIPLHQRDVASEDIGATISEELIDLLSRCSSLWVSSFSATECYADRRDPKLLARELGSNYVVDGSVRVRGSALRVTIRLIDANRGVQLWSETAVGVLEDVFDLQDRLALTIAENLRIELTVRHRRLELDPEASSLYIGAREALREGFASAPTAYEALDRALELEPEFEAAAGLRAIAALRAWFFDSQHDSLWQRRIEEAVTVARTIAPELSVTHQAYGCYALNTGDFAQAVRSFQRAMTIAPTNPTPAHYLGMIDAETGHFERGMGRLRLAHTLTPRAQPSITELARCTALLGHDADHDAWMAKLAVLPGNAFAYTATRMRVAAWRRDVETLAEVWQSVLRAGAESRRDLRFLRAYALEHEYAAALAEGRAWAQTLTNGRFRALIYQLLTELACFHGRVDDGLELLELAMSSLFIDIGWLERCPLLAALRVHPHGVDIHRRVRERVRSLWAPTLF